HGAAIAQRGLGTVLQGMGRSVRAIARFEKALPLFRRLGDRTGESITLGNLALVHRDRGRFDEAARLVRRAIVLRRGDREGLSRLNAALAAILHVAGRRDEARRIYLRVIAWNRRTGNRRLEAQALDNLGVLDAEEGRHARVEERWQAALWIHRELG